MKRLLVPGLPAALLLAAAAPVQAEAYLQAHANGAAIDWLDGSAVATGRAPILRPIKDRPPLYEENKEKAARDARARLLEALAQAPLDASRRLGAEEQVMARYAKMLDQEPATSVVQDEGPLFRVSMTIGLRGDRGVLGLLLPLGRSPEDGAGVTTASLAIPAQGEDITGLVIDARHLTEDRRAAPALLPRILDTEGRVVHGPATVDPAIARQFGLAGYAVAREGSEAVGRRAGSRPIEARAVRAEGELHSDIVIGLRDAERILAEAARTPFLKECRVVVLLPQAPAPPPMTPPTARPRPQPPSPAPREPREPR
ncbi:MAG TPA: hypothetical protein VJV23_15555 [Candidatus Polarisedimenticolia bacterium]|nr:hypothetical protein [Candidatus Polarisedimenticolia bacterium]